VVGNADWRRRWLRHFCWHPRRAGEAGAFLHRSVLASVLGTLFSRGIGAAVVKRLAQEGLKVAFFYRQRMDKVEELLEWARDAQFTVVPIKVDITDPRSLLSAITDAKANVGPIDCHITNCLLKKKNENLRKSYAPI